MKKGFTLVELLVVIAIVGILLAIAFSMFSSVQKTNRDQQRLRDLQTLKQALELYRTDNHSYPASLSDLDSNYLGTHPADPSTGQSYQYQKSPGTCQTANQDCMGFSLCAKKEGSQAYDNPAGCSSPYDMGISSN